MEKLDLAIWREGKEYSTQMMLNPIKKPSLSSLLSCFLLRLCNSNWDKLCGATNWKKKVKKDSAKS